MFLGGDDSSKELWVGSTPTASAVGQVFCRGQKRAVNPLGATPP